VKRLLVVVSAVVAICGSGCGGGGGVVNLPPPTGKYSLSSLKGTYAFMTNGEVITSATAAVQMARVGSFVADGNGGITGGVEDVNEVTVGVNTAVPITGGSYTVSADGRGTMTLNIGQSAINFGIVLTSINDGLLIDETSNATQASTGSGNFIKQDTTLCATPVSSIAGTYVFDFSGFDPSIFPESFVGEFTVNNTGMVTTSLGDLNDDFALSSGIAFSGSFAADNLNPAGPTICGRGQAQIAGTTYAFYVVNATRVRFMSLNSGGMLSGDAVLQQSIPPNISAISSGFAFVVAGSDGNGGLTRVGRFTANGAAVTSVLMDYNDSMGAHQTNTTTTASLTYDQTTGRGTLTFQDKNLQIPFVFVFYLSSATQGVLQETTGSTPGAKGIVAVSDGTIAAQTGGPFSSSNISGTYALNWSGISFQQNGQFIDEEDLVGQASVSSLALSGAADIFQFTAGVPLLDHAVTGAITINGDGTGGNSMSVTLSGANPIKLDAYFVSPQLAFFASHGGQSPTRILAGVLQLQN
jgi:hypothetical protein